MALITGKFAAAAAGLAAFSLTAMPVSAAPLPALNAAQVDIYDGSAEDMFGYRGRRHRDRGIDAGDVIAGVLVLGAVAAIASSASSNNDRRREREDVRYREARPSYGSTGLDRAAAMCIDQVERGSESVDEVDRAERNAGGWDFSGWLNTGDRFSCHIDNEGRIRSVDIGAGYEDAAYRLSGPAGGPQLSDADYARARAATRYQPVDDRYQQDDYGYGVDADLDGSQNQPMPAYPGGPLPGEPGYDDYVGG